MAAKKRKNGNDTHMNYYEQNMPLPAPMRFLRYTLSLKICIDARKSVLSPDKKNNNPDENKFT